MFARYAEQETLALFPRLLFSGSSLNFTGSQARSNMKFLVLHLNLLHRAKPTFLLGLRFRASSSPKPAPKTLEKPSPGVKGSPGSKVSPTFDTFALLITPTKNGRCYAIVGHVYLFVCLSVCLSCSQRDNLKNKAWIFTKFYTGV